MQQSIKSKKLVLRGMNSAKALNNESSEKQNS